MTQIFAENVEGWICGNQRNLWIAIGIGYWFIIGYPQMTQIFAENVEGWICGNL